MSALITEAAAAHSVHPNWVILAAMCALLDDQCTVVDREAEQEKRHDPSGHRIRCPLCGWSPREDDRWACDSSVVLDHSRLRGDSSRRGAAQLKQHYVRYIFPALKICQQGLN